MAGSISLSLSQQFDAQGKPLAGGQLFFFASGTTTPQSAYQDSALTIVHPNPITLDAAGRVPAFYLADGAIKIRLTDIGGVTIIAADNLLVIGPSSGAGGGASVDPTTVLTTGDIKYTYGTGTISGFVRGNGRTIGSATSGATEFANATAQSLFQYLWTADANLVVSTGRGLSANADWVANKTITLPDFRGRVLAALDDMGNTAAGRLTSGGSGIVGTTLGAAGGVETVTLAQSALPNVSPTITITDPGHTHTFQSGIASRASADGSGNNYTGWATGGIVLQVINAAATGISAAIASLNGNVTQTAINNMPPALTVTVYVKL